MFAEWIPQIVTGAITAGITIGFVRTELHWLRRDVDDLREEIRSYKTRGPQ